MSVPSRGHLACEARGPLLLARRWDGAEERLLVFNTGDSPAAFDYALGEVMMSSGDDAATGLRALDGRTVPPRVSLLLARRS